MVPKSPRLLSKKWLAMALVGALILTNVALLHQNRVLLSAHANSISVRQLQPGEAVPPILAGINVLADEYVSVDLRVARANTLLIYVSADCPACIESMDLLREAASNASEDWQVVWISKDSPADSRAFFAAYGIDDDMVLAEVPWHLYLRLGLHAVPTTVIVGRDGSVRRAWHGRVDAGDLQEIMGHIAEAE